MSLWPLLSPRLRYPQDDLTERRAALFDLPGILGQFIRLLSRGKYSLGGPSSLFWEGRKRKRQKAAARHRWALWKPGAGSALRACPIPTVLAGHLGRLNCQPQHQTRVSCPSERNILPFPQEATFQMYVNNRIRFKSRCKDYFPHPQVILT